MNIEYSKSLNDIAKESEDRLKKNTAIKYIEQINSSKFLESVPPRENCLLCNQKLIGDKFTHRNIGFIRCMNCDHIQTFGIPPDNYPYFETNTNFSNIYPSLNIKDYTDRVERIYKPKLDWIMRVLNKRFVNKDFKSKEWVEFGCGAGYFLTTLSSDGFKKISGYEKDPMLVNKAVEMTPSYVKVYHGDDNLHDTVAKTSADVYVAFFVLEHVENPHKFYQVLSGLPQDTIFIFSVPIFGISCLLEGAFDNLYARNLDAVVHTQIYTEKSIDYALNIAEFDIISQWVFGQDAEDFSRFIIDSISENFPDEMFQEISTKLLDLQDPLQRVFDRNHFSDQRHIIAIKR